MQTPCKCGREVCPLEADWLKVMKLYNENIKVKNMTDRVGKTANQIYKLQRKIIDALKLPTIAHAVLYCGKKGCI